MSNGTAVLSPQALLPEELKKGQYLTYGWKGSVLPLSKYGAYESNQQSYFARVQEARLANSWPQFVRGYRLAVGARRSDLSSFSVVEFPMAPGANSPITSS